MIFLILTILEGNGEIMLDEILWVKYHGKPIYFKYLIFEEGTGTIYLFFH